MLGAFPLQCRGGAADLPLKVRSNFPAAANSAKSASRHVRQHVAPQGGQAGWGSNPRSGASRPLNDSLKELQSSGFTPRGKKRQKGTTGAQGGPASPKSPQKGNSEGRKQQSQDAATSSSAAESGQPGNEGPKTQDGPSSDDGASTRLSESDLSEMLQQLKEIIQQKSTRAAERGQRASSKPSVRSGSNYRRIRAPEQLEQVDVKGGKVVQKRGWAAFADSATQQESGDESDDQGPGLEMVSQQGAIKENDSLIFCSPDLPREGSINPKAIVNHIQTQHFDPVARQLQQSEMVLDQVHRQVQVLLRRRQVIISGVQQPTAADMQAVQAIDVAIQEAESVYNELFYRTHQMRAALDTILHYKTFWQHAKEFLKENPSMQPFQILEYANVEYLNRIGSLRDPDGRRNKFADDVPQSFHPSHMIAGQSVSFLADELRQRTWYKFAERKMAENGQRSQFRDGLHIQ